MSSANATSAPPNAPGPFQPRVCRCWGNSCKIGYRNTYETCLAWCRGEGARFVNNEWTCGWYPANHLSIGGCSICGNNTDNNLAFLLVSDPLVCVSLLFVNAGPVDPCQNMQYIDCPYNP